MFGFGKKKKVVHEIDKPEMDNDGKVQLTFVPRRRMGSVTRWFDSKTQLKKWCRQHHPVRFKRTETKPEEVVA